MKNFQHIELFQASKSPKAPQQPKKKEKEGKTFICFKPSSWGITKASPPLLSNSFFYTESFSANSKRDLTFVFWVFFTIPGFIPKTHRAGE